MAVASGQSRVGALRHEVAPPTDGVEKVLGVFFQDVRIWIVTYAMAVVRVSDR